MDNNGTVNTITDTGRDPVISIIIPCYNAAQTIGRTIASALEQSYENIEIVVIDDGSRDDSVAILRGLATEDARIRIVEQENQGPAVARNRGLKESSGALIAFLDSDDYWDPHCLKSLYTALATNRDCVLAYCGWQNIGLAGGRGKPFVPPDYEKTLKPETFLRGCRWPIHAALTWRGTIEAIGGFDESLTSCMDYDLWLRIGASNKITLVPKVLAYYVHHEGDQITKNKTRLAYNHLSAQKNFIANNPRLVECLSRNQVRDILFGEILRRGYQCYWARDLKSARQIFLIAMKAGYGTLRDWKYMLASWLPEPVHAWVISNHDDEVATGG